MTTVDWLLGAQEPWVRWGTRVHLLGAPADDPDVAREHRHTLGHPAVRALLDEVLAWPDPPMKNHKQAAHPLHKIGLLVDMGLTAADPEGAELADRILAHHDPDGPFQCVELVPRAFGGSGVPEPGWMGCDAPLLVHALLALGLGDDPRVGRALEHLIGLVRPGGWPCAMWIPGARGPGRKDDPCPYADLVSLRALSLSAHRDSEACHQGTEMLLSHWEQRAARKIRMFGIGTDFAKPKYPLVWYDVVHFLEVLSRFEWTHADPRFGEVLDLLLSQADDHGRFTPRSVWMTFKGLDFAQKRQPSPTLTLAVERIRRRAS